MPPEVGDIAWVEFDPVRGTEQAGRRPALILSAKTYHEASRRALVCPITSRARDWPFNIPLPKHLITTGFVLVDQLRMIDRTERMFDIIERAPSNLLTEVRGKIAALLAIDTFASRITSENG